MLMGAVELDIGLMARESRVLLRKRNQSETRFDRLLVERAKPSDATWASDPDCSTTDCRDAFACTAVSEGETGNEAVVAETGTPLRRAADANSLRDRPDADGASAFVSV